MRPLIPALLMAVFAMPAYAACPAIEGQDINDEYVQAFMKGAEKMGAPCAVSFNDDGVTALIQYLPNDETLKEWKSMVAANIIYLGDRKPTEEIQKLADKFAARIKDKDGETETVLEAPSAFGTMKLIKYTVHEDGYDEKALVMVRPVGPDKAALLHWHKRDGSFTDAEIKMFGEINGVGGKIIKTEVKPDSDEPDRLIMEVEGTLPEAEAKPAKPAKKKEAAKPKEDVKAEVPAAEPVKEEKKPEAAAEKPVEAPKENLVKEEPVTTPAPEAKKPEEPKKEEPKKEEPKPPGY